jgi:signal transduction histidine kinase
MNIDCPPMLDYLRQLADTEHRPPVEAVFHQLAKYFDAAGIGVTTLNGAQTHVAHFFHDTAAPATYPWQTGGDFLQRLHRTLHGLAHQDSCGDWLASLGWEPRSGEALLTWLYRPGNRGWKDPETVLWPIAGQTLVRWLAHDPAVPSNDKLCRKLEQTAQVASKLSHDFGNYLTGILGFTELSIPLIPSGGVLPRYLQEVLQSARQGSEWIKRLQWFCRRGGHNSWPTELSSVLDDAKIRSGPGPLPKWEKKIPLDLPLLAIDATSLQTLLSELASNAREATQGQGVLTFAATATELTEAACLALVGDARPGRFVEIAVSDDGPGFTAEARTKLFHEPFFSTKPRQRGLGLMVSYGILYRFHGGLRVDHDEVAPKGACVRVYVPAATVAAAAAANENKPHLLLVHPDPLLFESLRKILEWQGYRVSLALTAQTALSLYQTPGQSFALILAEAQLPQLSGFDLARRILEHDPRASFLFLYTQSSFQGLPEEEMLKRFTVLRWPVETATFVETVRTTLARFSSA